MRTQTLTRVVVVGGGAGSDDAPPAASVGAVAPSEDIAARGVLRAL